MRYQSYRLQVWQSDRFGYVQWSARLEEMQGGENHRFSSPNALLSYLQSLLTLDLHPIVESPNRVENEGIRTPDRQEETTDEA